MTTEVYMQRLQQLRHLPDQDKSLLASRLSVSYGQAEAVLPELSIFRSKFPSTSIGEIEITETGKEQLFYIGHHFRSNLSVFCDNEKKLIFNSRFYFASLNSFLLNIDPCLYHLSNIDLDDALNIGTDFLSIQRWFITYGHFKDEAYTLGDVLSRLPNSSETRALLDYPTDNRLDTSKFLANKNYQKIDRLIFSQSSLNAYRLGSIPLALTGLKLVTNKYSSPTFHSFPPSVTARIRSQVEQLHLQRGPKRIFLTRSNSYRDPLNKSEIEAYCAARGYTIINPELISYEELVQLSGDAERVICYWGSACTNWIYFRPGTRICALKAQSYSSEPLTFWSKVIKAYDLLISEVVAEENIISITKLDTIEWL
jgi:hypothetical protein